jgi:hypothetical protein
MKKVENELGKFKKEGEREWFMLLISLS